MRAPLWTIMTRPDADAAEHVVTYGAERFSVTFRSVDPVVHVQGTTLSWEAVVRVPDGRAFYGYGADRADAFRSAYQSATSAGVLTGVDMGFVAGALCRVRDASSLLS